MDHFLNMVMSTIIELELAESSYFDSSSFYFKDLRPGIIENLKRSKGTKMFVAKSGRKVILPKKHKHGKRDFHRNGADWMDEFTIKTILERKALRNPIKTLNTKDSTFKEIFLEESLDYTNDNLKVKRDKNGFLEFASFSS